MPIVIQDNEIFPSFGERVEDTSREAEVNLNDQELDALARKVIEVLKQELVLERERLAGW
ncbi:MAG TPA: hypothetical protein ENN19_17920 [Chloroflexi bacterium]|nr:hypothetical protein [Chloroflexota bacterium]